MTSSPPLQIAAMEVGGIGSTFPFQFVRDEPPEAIRATYGRIAKQARPAPKQDRYRRTLELAKEAEALAQVHHFREKLPGTGEACRNLQGYRGTT